MLCCIVMQRMRDEYEAIKGEGEILCRHYENHQEGSQFNVPIRGSFICRENCRVVVGLIVVVIVVVVALVVIADSLVRASRHRHGTQFALSCFMSF